MHARFGVIAGSDVMAFVIQDEERPSSSNFDQGGRFREFGYKDRFSTPQTVLQSDRIHRRCTEKEPPSSCCVRSVLAKKLVMSFKCFSQHPDLMVDDCRVRFLPSWLPRGEDRAICH